MKHNADCLQKPGKQKTDEYIMCGLIHKNTRCGSSSNILYAQMQEYNS